MPDCTRAATAAKEVVAKSIKALNHEEHEGHKGKEKLFFVLFVLFVVPFFSGPFNTRPVAGIDSGLRCHLFAAIGRLFNSDIWILECSVVNVQVLNTQNAIKYPPLA